MSIKAQNPLQHLHTSKLFNNFKAAINTFIPVSSSYFMPDEEKALT